MRNSYGLNSTLFSSVQQLTALPEHVITSPLLFNPLSLTNNDCLDNIEIVITLQKKYSEMARLITIIEVMPHAADGQSMSFKDPARGLFQGGHLPGNMRWFLIEHT